MHVSAFDMHFSCMFIGFTRILNAYYMQHKALEKHYKALTTFLKASHMHLNTFECLTHTVEHVLTNI